MIHRSNVRQFQPLDLAELLDQAVYDSVPQAEPAPDVRLALPIDGAPRRPWATA